MVPGVGGRAPGRPMAPRAKQRDRQPPTAFPSALPSPHASDTDGHPELHCLRRLLPAATLAWAADRAERLGTGADRALIAARLIDEETYLRALGRALGIAFAPLDDKGRADCPLDDAELIATAATGLLPLSDGDSAAPIVAVAPRGVVVRGLIEMIRRDPARAARFQFTTNERFVRFIMRTAGDALADRATHGLQQRWPDLSAATRRIGWGNAVAAVSTVTATAAALLMPQTTLHVFELLLLMLFLSWFGLRLIGAFTGDLTSTPDRAVPDSALPVYSIVAALYREATSVPGLLGAIGRFDYPPEKLDVIIAVEEDDHDTRAALSSFATKFPITVIPAPPSGPRTKPKALNVALPFARGTYTVVYDAEDRPEPDQLRRSLQAFLAGPANLACVQARLCIDNGSDSWLTAYFTAEYAGQFDISLPGLAALGLPLPLGGSSNHFHTEALRQVGAWDPFNVTEDADLGMRLARFGFRSGVITSTTYEEAPARALSWLRQRTRWFKGWMQTWLVHMRAPVKTCRQLGVRRFSLYLLYTTGLLLSALLHPFMLISLIWGIVLGLYGYHDPRIMAAVIFNGMNLLTAYLSFHVLCKKTLRYDEKRGYFYLLGVPLYWLLLSFASWRAFYQMFTAPHHWEKTPHFPSRTENVAGTTANAETLQGLPVHSAGKTLLPERLVTNP